MTLTATPRVAGPFNGTGVLLSYPFTFKVFEAADVEVTLLSSAGLETVAVNGSDCLVTVNGDQEASPGGSVQYAISGVATALPTGWSITVTGAGLDYTQEADLPAAGNFNPTTVENALDRATMLIQLIREEVARALRVSVSTPAGFDATLPAPTAGQILGWNGSGTGFANYPVGTAEGSALAIALANTTDADAGDELVGQGAIVSVLNGVLTRHASLHAAVSFLGTTRCAVVVRKDVTMSASATFPATATLRIENAARITTTGYTLTVNGPREFHEGQCFVGTGTVSLARGFQPLRPQWWGGAGDGTTDSDAAFAAMTTAVKATTDQEQAIILEAGDYRVNKWVMTGLTNVTIICRGAVFITGKSTTTDYIAAIVGSNEATATRSLKIDGTLSFQTAVSGYTAGLYARWLVDSQIDATISGAFSAATVDLDAVFNNDFKWLYATGTTSGTVIVKLGQNNVNANKFRLRIAGSGAANSQVGLEASGSNNDFFGDISAVATGVNLIAARGSNFALYTEATGKSFACPSGISRGINIFGGTYEVLSSTTGFDFSGGGSMQGLNIVGVRFNGESGGSARQAINWGTLCYETNLFGHDLQNIDTEWTGTLNGATGGVADQLVGATRHRKNGVFQYLGGWADTVGALTVSGAGTYTPNSAAYSSVIATVSTASGFTFANPSGTPIAGQKMKATFKNTSGGAMGTVTFGANYKHGAITMPATGNSFTIVWEYDGTNWVEEARGSNAVPN